MLNKSLLAGEKVGAGPGAEHTVDRGYELFDIFVP